MTDADASRPGGEGALSGRESVPARTDAGFRRAIGLITLGTVIPGAGLTQARSKRLGWVILALFLLTAVVTAYIVLRDGFTNAALYVVARPSFLQAAAIAFIVTGTLWCGSIILTAMQTRPSRLGRTRTRILAGLTTVLVFLVAGSTFKVAEYTLITRDTVRQVFRAADGLPEGQGVKVVEGEDPWAATSRVNMLMMGSDSGVGRTGTRTDSMIVASIDTKTGRTALISLPRNLEKVPLPADSPLRKLYPSGTYGSPVCLRQQADPNDQCMLNAIWTEVDQFRQDHPRSFSGRTPGRDETRDVISRVLGLRIDHTVVMDLAGFARLIDAMGGINLNVKESGYGSPLPKGGKVVDGRVVGVTGYFKPGYQHLEGNDALWYARSRAADDDNYRQARQRCVVQAIVSQVNPGEMVSKYPEVNRIAKDNIYTDIPVQNLPAFVELIQRVQRSKITSVSLTNIKDYSSAHPDYAAIRALVRASIAAPKPADADSPKPTTTKPKAPTTPGPTTTPYERC